MNETVITVLVIFGIMAVTGILIMIGYFVYEVILEFIRRRQIRYIQKHRFDGSPTAKCWNKAKQACRAHSGWYTAPDWFCCDAEPRTNFGDYKEE